MLLVVPGIMLAQPYFGDFYGEKVCFLCFLPALFAPPPSLRNLQPRARQREGWRQRLRPSSFYAETCVRL